MPPRNDNEDYATKNLSKPTTNRPLTVPSQPIFRLGWCGNDNPCQPTAFHSIRRSGGFLVLFNYRKRTKPPRGQEREKSLKLQISLLNPNPNKKNEYLSFDSKKKQKPFFSSKAAGANQPHTKTKSTRAAFYGRVKQCPCQTLKAFFCLLFYSC